MMGCRFEPSKTQRPGIRLILWEDDGPMGIGEAVPLPGYSPETLDEAQAVLEAILGALSVMRIGDEWREDLRTLFAEMPLGAPSARFALETAFLDFTARRQGVSVASLIGDSKPCRAPVNALLSKSASDEAALRMEVQGWRDRGISAFKLKTGGGQKSDATTAVRRSAIQETVATLALLREEFDGLTLRADANGAWSPEEAQENLAALAPYGLQYIEEPVSGLDLLDLNSPIPVAIDESLLHRPTAARLFATEAPSCLKAIILKPTILGGVLACREIQRQGEALGMTGIFTHAFEGAVGYAAICEAVAAFGGDSPHGLAPYSEVEAIATAHFAEGNVGSAMGIGSGKE